MKPTVKEWFVGMLTLGLGVYIGLQVPFAVHQRCAIAAAVVSAALLGTAADVVLRVKDRTGRHSICDCPHGWRDWDDCPDCRRP